MKKSLIALLLVLALVITVSVFAVSASETKTTDKQLWSELTVAEDGQTATGYCPHCCADPSESVTWKVYTPKASGHNYPSASGHWFLGASITTNGALFFSTSNTEFVLHLNGKTYNRGNGTSNNTGIIVPQASGVKVSIVDGEAQTGALIGTYGWAVRVNGTNCQVNLYSGKLASSATAAHNSGYGGAVRVEKGVFNMYGGAINDGYNTYGGAIYVGAGTSANLYGGTISGASAGYGGAIYATGNGAKVLIDGATIENCYATNRAGAIMITGSGTTASMEMKSGRISNCFVKDGSTTEFGGNIYLEYTKGVISGGIIENGGIPATGVTVTADTNHKGGNFCLRGGGAQLTVKDDAIIRGGKAAEGGNVYVGYGSLIVEGGSISGGNATTGGNVYLVSDHDMTMTGGEITGGIATGNGGNIYTGGNNTIIIDAAEGKTVKITKGKAAQGGNLRLSLSSNTTVTGPNVTISGGTCTVAGPDIRIVGDADKAATLTLTDVTMKGAGTHGTTVSVAPYGHVVLAGATDIDRVQIESETLADKTAAVATGAQILIKEGYKGTAYVGWSHGATAAAVLPGATTHHSLWQEAGYTGTGAIYAIDGSTSGKLLADTGDAADTDSKFVVATFAGVKVAADGKQTLTPIGSLEEAAGYDFVRPFFNDPITLVDDLTLDLNNATVHVITGEHKLNLIEMRTDSFNDAGDVKDGYVRGYVTVDDEENVNTVVREQATGNQYIVVPTGETADGLTKFTAHRVQVDIDSVNIKPASMAMYYTTNMDTTPTASEFALSYGVVLSLVDMPGANFKKDDSNEDTLVDNLYTEIDFYLAEDERVQVRGANSALLQGILSQGADTNKEWGEMPIYANAYVSFVIDGEEVCVMADKTYTLSLLDILMIVDETMDPSSETISKMYGTWANPLAVWGEEGKLPNMYAAYGA